MQLLSLDDFVCPGDFSELHRFVTVKKPSTVCSSYYLLERKPFDPNIFPADMARLTSRIQRLVVLLQRKKSLDFCTPQAEGCIKDPANCCWWIVFRFPLYVDPSPHGPDVGNVETLRVLKKKKGAPVSLLSLLNPNHTLSRK